MSESSFGGGGTDLFPTIDLWASSGLWFGCLGWAEGPGVSKPWSRLGCVVNKGGSAAASDGAHLVVSPQRSSLWSCLAAVRHLCPSTAIGMPCRAGIRVCRWLGIAPVVCASPEDIHPICVSSPTYWMISPAFLRNFYIVFTSIEVDQSDLPLDSDWTE